MCLRFCLLWADSGAALTCGRFTWMSCAKKRAAPSWRSGLINSTNQPVTVKPSICSPMGPRGTHRRPHLQHGDEPPRRSSCDTGPTKDRSFPPSMDGGGRVTLGVHFHRYPPTVLRSYPTGLDIRLRRDLLVPHKSRPPDAMSKPSHPQYFHITEHSQHKQQNGKQRSGTSVPIHYAFLL